ncbi:MAG: hypothetical protein ACM3JB_27435, partial [Acidobacteriaceae bacterium]
RQPLLALCLSDTVHEIRAEALGAAKVHKKGAVRSVPRQSQRTAAGMRRYCRANRSQIVTAGHGTGEIVS